MILRMSQRASHYVAGALNVFIIVNITTAVASILLPVYAFDCPKLCICHNKVINCDKQKLSTVPKALPVWPQNFLLSNNRISTLHAFSFPNMTSLIQLSLSNNSLYNISENAFEGLIRLERLDISGNKIFELPENTFDGCPNLEHLWIADNLLSLESLNQSLVSLRNLKVLNLSGNNFDQDPHLPAGFQQLIKLSKLILSFTRISNLTADFFVALVESNLSYLDISHCTLRAVYNETFSPLAHLHTLNMNVDLLNADLMESLFYGLQNSSIRLLHLQYEIVYDDSSHISPSMFKHLHSTRLKILHLEGNYGGFPNGLHSHHFRHTPKLEHLYLDHCAIGKINSHAFRGLSKLKTLSLRRNTVTCIGGCPFLGIHASRLPHLEILDLSHNLISGSFHQTQLIFEGDSFPNLRVFNLSLNRITGLERGMFNSFRDLEMLDLTDNFIFFIEARTFYSGLHSLQTLFIRNNPHLRILQNDTFLGLMQLKRLILSGNDIHDVHARSLTGLISLEVLDLSHNNIHSLNAVSEMESSKLHVLDLSNNELVSWPFTFLKKQERLTQINLSFNRLTVLDQNMLKSNMFLKSLDLSKNALTVLKSYTFQNCTILEKLKLGGNPWLCTCDMKLFIDNIKPFLHDTHNKNSYKCVGPEKQRGISLLKFEPSDWVCHYKNVIVPIVAAILWTVLITGITSLICLERQKMAYNKQNRPTSPDSEEGDPVELPNGHCDWLREMVHLHREPQLDTEDEEGRTDNDPLIMDSDDDEEEQGEETLT